MRILLVDDDNISRDMLADILSGLISNEIVQADSAKEALDLHSINPFKLVFTDIKMPGMNGIDLLKKIRQKNRDNTEVVLFTGYAELDTAVEAIKYGARDYLFKPVDIKKVIEIIQDVEVKGKAVDKKSYSEIDESKINSLLQNGAFFVIPNVIDIGIFSNKMKEILNTALKLHEDRSIPVLIEGESGTGKEIAAKIIHYGPEGRDAPLVSINCSAITENLFESELFGYEGGSFTGAKIEGMKGKLERAQGETILLDEIGDLSLKMQPKLLRVLQERNFFRIGGSRPIKLDVRVLAATNKNLKLLVEEGKFREDLFHRLNTGWINMPPLRTQSEAIGPLAQMFLTQFAEIKNKQFRSISEESLRILENYDWPGNIRELRNLINRVTLLYNEIEL
ncbi:MAG: sigma-54-dependent transcriptional regulator, partial [Bacteroidota bacterium]